MITLIDLELLYHERSSWKEDIKNKEDLKYITNTIYYTKHRIDGALGYDVKRKNWLDERSIICVFNSKILEFDNCMLNLDDLIYYIKVLLWINTPSYYCINLTLV